MAQQVFPQWSPVVKAHNEDQQEVYIPAAIIHAQTRDGKDELIVGAANMQFDPETGDYLPTHAGNPVEVRARALETLLQTLGKEETLALVKAALDVLVSKDFATELTLDGVKSAVDALAGTVDAGAQKVTLSGSSELKKASLGAFVTHRTATLVRGVNIWFNTTATNPLDSNERVVVVDIAGPGRLIQADIYATDNQSGVRPRLSVDAHEQNVFVLHGMTHDARLGLTEGRRVGAWEVVKNSTGKYAISLDGARVGAWGTSFKLELENATSQEVGMAAYVWYAVMSSSNLVLAGSGAPIPAQDVRGVLATNWPTLDDYTVITRPGDDQGNGWECEVFWRNGVAEQAIRSLLAQEFGLNQLHS